LNRKQKNAEKKEAEDDLKFLLDSYKKLENQLVSYRSTMEQHESVKKKNDEKLANHDAKKKSLELLQEESLKLSDARKELLEQSMDSSKEIRKGKESYDAQKTLVEQYSKELEKQNFQITSLEHEIEKSQQSISDSLSSSDLSNLLLQHDNLKQKESQISDLHESMVHSNSQVSSLSSSLSSALSSLSTRCCTALTS
jgi:DNA repair exonuclease SbcCD ATPase subunit